VLKALSSGSGSVNNIIKCGTSGKIQVSREIIQQKSNNLSLTNKLCLCLEENLQKNFVRFGSSHYFLLNHRFLVPA